MVESKVPPACSWRGLSLRGEDSRDRLSREIAVPFRTRTISCISLLAQLLSSMAGFAPDQTASVMEHMHEEVQDLEGQLSLRFVRLPLRVPTALRWTMNTQDGFHLESGVAPTPKKETGMNKGKGTSGHPLLCRRIF